MLLLVFSLGQMDFIITIDVVKDIQPYICGWQNRLENQWDVIQQTWNLLDLDFNSDHRQNTAAIAKMNKKAM